MGYPIGLGFQKSRFAYFRVNCLQALYDLKTPALQHDYDLIVESLSHIPIASLQARIRILAKK